MVDVTRAAVAQVSLDGRAGFPVDSTTFEDVAPRQSKQLVVDYELAVVAATATATEGGRLKIGIWWSTHEPDREPSKPEGFKIEDEDEIQKSGTFPSGD